MVSACARRQQVAYASARGLSQRRACALIRTARSGLRYESKKTASDAAAVTKMMELARQYLRYGYRRIRIFLGREGYKMSYDRAYRLWRIAKLQVPKKRPRRRVAAARPKAIVATGPNQVWAYDFVFDACANGQQLKCLTVIDEHTREALTIDVAGSIRSARVIESLAKLISVHGAPRALKSDNGPEFVSRAILRWLTGAGIDCVLSDPGKPWQNGHDESFNGKFRDECLSMEWFRNRHEAVPIIEAWRRHYSEVRPHSSLDYQTPIEFKTGTIKKTTQPLEADSQ